MYIRGLYEHKTYVGYVRGVSYVGYKFFYG